jgi:hypothetical protein
MCCTTKLAVGSAHLIVLFGCVQFAPLSTGSAWITYLSGTVPVPLLHSPLHCPAVTQVALQATGLHGFLLLHAVIKRVSPTSASQAVPFRSAGVVMTYLQHTRNRDESNRHHLKRSTTVHFLNQVLHNSHQASDACSVGRHLASQYNVTKKLRTARAASRPACHYQTSAKACGFYITSYLLHQSCAPFRQQAAQPDVAAAAGAVAVRDPHAHTVHRRARRVVDAAYGVPAEVRTREYYLPQSCRS